MTHQGMVHALRQVHRLLKPSGILIDLRPAAEHRRVGLGEGRRWKFVGWMREDLTDDRAADRAVKRATALGWFRANSRVEFNLDRVMDTLEDFREWISDFPAGRLPPSDERLYRRVEFALAQAREGTRIVARGPLRLAVLRKLDGALPSKGGSR
jgi:hypothetical protein